jgi:hypothetical protein
VNLVKLFPVMFHLETWRNLTQPAGANFHPLWKAALLLELFGNLICLFWAFLLIVLFFRKRATWPRCYAAFLLFLVAFVGFDFWLSGRIPAAAGAPGETIRGLVQVLVAAAIWAPYCFLSKRVKATFLR